MKKILVLLSAMLATNVFADSLSSESDEYASFKKFDRQFSFGLSMANGSLNSSNGTGNYNDTAVSVDVERLFNNGVWMDVSAFMYAGYYQSPGSDPAVPVVGGLTGSDPMFGGLNAKVGYAFPLIKDHLLLTPYGMVGRNVNLSYYTLQYTTQATMEQDYYWTLGGGARLEYRVDDMWEFYLDQNLLYNASQAPVGQGVSQPNFRSNTTTLGLKANVWSNLQLGANVYDTVYYYPTALTVNNSTGPTSVLVPSNSLGIMVSAGLTY